MLDMAVVGRMQEFCAQGVLESSQRGAWLTAVKPYFIANFQRRWHDGLEHVLVPPICYILVKFQLTNVVHHRRLVVVAGELWNSNDGL